MINSESLDLLHKKLVHTLKNSTLNDLQDYIEEPELFSRECMLNVFKTIYTAEEVSQDHILKFIKDDLNEYGIFYDKNKDEYIYSEYWDYNDSLSEDTLVKLLNEYKDEPDSSFHAIVYAYFLDQDWFTYYDKMCEIKRDYMDLYVSKDLHGNEEFHIEDLVLDYIYNIVVHEDNLERVIGNTKADNLAIYLGGDPEDEYLDHICWTDAYNEFYDDEEISEDTLKEIENTYMGKFIVSQGYNVKDVFKEDKDKFLKEVYEELYEYDELRAMQLTFVPNTSNWSAIAKLYKKEPVIIKAGTLCGLFDRVYGGGCGMNITTVKDFELKDLEYDVTTYNDYTPETVYGGFIKPNKEQLEIIS